MKTPLILLVAGCVFISSAARGAETAHARLYCLSLRFQEARDIYEYFAVDLTTLSSGVNGELAPDFFNSGYSHSAYLVLTDTTVGDQIPGTMALDVPNANANGNRFSDFFEVSQAVSGTVTSGIYNFPGLASGAVQATWNRAAGSKDGTCTLVFKSLAYGSDDTFSCPFELIEYAGPLAYAPGSNTVSAVIQLIQTGNPANTLQGPMDFDKSSTDRFNTLTNQPGTWTNAASQSLSFDSEIFSRVATWPTNYAGYVYFADGDPGTTSPDYRLWVLSIDDTNDANANGIPDFSDVPAVVTPPSEPLVSLAPGATNLWLTISGDVGHTNEIQELDSLTATNWQTAVTLKLTNNPQTVSLPLPTNQMKFWRVLTW
ncbi:MAG TPA: hypothetical protein VFY06_13665 [Verrucomicrobiae bacterium]|nr:hypothetical protein [Verrucomicrobiae bacterium]